MGIKIRKSNLNDSHFLEELESSSFPDFQRSTKQSILRSLKSNFQEVLIAYQNNGKKTPLGSLVLHKHKNVLRIYSIAVKPGFRETGIGSLLLDEAFKLAKKQEYSKISLEAFIENTPLIKWYESKGFSAVKIIKDYYQSGKDALKMELKLNGEKTSNIIVINHPHNWKPEDINAKIISVKEYINNPFYHSNTDLRVFNLCSSYKYQSYGYYVSLLASARGQRVIPSTSTIRDFNISHVIRSAGYDIEEVINKSLKNVHENIFHLKIFFGQTTEKKLDNLAMKLYQIFEAPLFEAVFVKHEKWIIKDLKVLTFKHIQKSEIDSLNNFARQYFSRKRFNKTKLINYKYDMAILVNPQETTPPSCDTALQKFKQTAHKMGIYTEFITKSDFDKINEFDALFIRETTNVNDHTYKFSRMAYAEGLVVIDDPWSILKCSNKIFQNELFRRNKILTPETSILSKNSFDKKMLNEMSFPLVLKQPDSAFSLGVIKVNDAEETLLALNDLFKKSDMIVCQNYLYSEFDWRIGIIDNQPLFACKYYMSKGHWQICNWKEEEHYGNSETLPVEEAPEEVVRTALKAARLIGDGLYGVDLKMVDDKVYVVEVNDNPNIDANVEDLVLKERLYESIVGSIYQRIEIMKNVQKINFSTK